MRNSSQIIFPVILVMKRKKFNACGTMPILVKWMVQLIIIQVYWNKRILLKFPLLSGYSGYLKVWSGFGVSGTTCVRSTRKFLKCNCSWLTLILNVTSENVLYDSFQFINFFSSSFLPEFTYLWKVSWSLITKVKLVRLPFQVEKFIFSIAWTIYLIFFLILYHGFNLLFYSRDWILN